MMTDLNNHFNDVTVDSTSTFSDFFNSEVWTNDQATRLQQRGFH